MNRETVLVIEDEDDILELITVSLTREGFRVLGAGTGEEGLALARAEAPDLIVLDLMLPGMDGLQVCRELRADPRARALPVLILTARGEEADVVAGLETGADDYMTKPFSPKVLVARVRTVLRRRAAAPGSEGDVLRVRDLVIHPGRHAVLAGERPVELTATEFRLLHFLARRPGWVFTRNQIVQAVRGDGYPVTERSVDVQIYGLRRKLGGADDYVETVRGVGYRFKDD
ncbi:MAG: response regulator [Candidatus Krumholzibacteriia bacterium]